MNTFEICGYAQDMEKTLILIDNFKNGIDKHIGVSDHQIEIVAEKPENFLCADFAAYLYRNKEAACYFSLFGEYEELLNLGYASELLKDYPSGYIRLITHARNHCEPSYRQFVDDNFEEYALKVDVKRLHGYLPAQHRNNKPLIRKLVAQSLDYAKYVDNELLKECVKDSALILSEKSSAVRGKIVLMRQLVNINRDCAKYALSPITTQSSVKNEDSPEERERKIYQWLTATDVRKTLKTAGVLVASKQAAATPKKVHKI